MALRAATLTILTAGLTCLAVPAHATTAVKSSEDAKPAVSKMTYWRKTAVAPTQSDKDSSLILVVNDQGETFYNHVRSDKHLAKIRSDVDAVKTYRINHKGRTYINKITKGGK